MQTSGHVWMWELDHKESWAEKLMLLNCGELLEETLESPLDCKEIQPVHSKGNQSWIFIERIDAEAEAPILWPPDTKNWLIRKHSDAGEDWRQEEKGTTEDQMIGSHHQLHGQEFERAPGVANGQGGLVCYSPWGRKESDTIEQLTWTWVDIICSLNSILNLFEILFHWYSSPTKVFFNERSLHF